MMTGGQQVRASTFLDLLIRSSIQFHIQCSLYITHRDLDKTWS